MPDEPYAEKILDGYDRIRLKPSPLTCLGLRPAKYVRGDGFRLGEALRAGDIHLEGSESR